MKKTLKRDKGITLIALVVTIIVLLILAGVAIATLTGNSSIIENSNKAAQAYNETASEEDVLLKELEYKLKEYTGVNNDSKEDEKKDDEHEQKSDGSWDDTAKVNTPNLMEGMVAVYWSVDGGKTASITQEGATEIYEKIDSNGKPSSAGTLNPNFDKTQWYNYVAGDNSTDIKTSRWANAITEDGSYWVWIPRFKYKITELPTSVGATTSGKIDVKFIPTSEKTGVIGYTTTANSEGEMLTKDSNNYIIHPAFENGSSTGKNNGYANGEWKSEISGFWIAKYEMSMEDKDENTVVTSNNTIGNVALSDNTKMVSKPNVSSWRYIQVGQAYQNCYNYDRDKESHLIKNSEWGAVAYLTHSQYGRNRNEITINNNSNFITGIAGDTVSASKSTSTSNSYNTTKGMLASTTGNVYGIYDMSGGAWEYTSNWNLKGNSSNGKAIDGMVYYEQNGTNSEYKTAYSNGTGTNNGSMVKSVCKTGDGIKETYIGGNSYNSYAWFCDYSYFFSINKLFSIRGGGFSRESNAGIFFSGDENGSALFDTSFRIVLI